MAAVIAGRLRAARLAAAGGEQAEGVGAEVGAARACKVGVGVDGGDSGRTQLEHVCMVVRVSHQRNV
jgi:hypothetical protein